MESPRLRFVNRSDPRAEIWHRLQPTDGGERTSYYIVGASSDSSSMKLSKGDFEYGSRGSPDLIAGIHVQKSGIMFIEALNPAQAVRLARRTDSKPTPAKQALPCSDKSAKERMLVLLDSDATIYTKSGAIIFELGVSPISVIGESEISTEEDEAQVLVQQSLPREPLRRSESDISRSTPAILEAVAEEPRVHETPSVKSRFMDPASATVTLPRAKLSRVEDTFGNVVEDHEDSTPTGKKSTSIEISPSKKANMGTPNDAAEAIRRQLSQAAMITSFGSAMDEIVSSVVDEDEEEGMLSDESTTPKNHIKGHGVPEGFLHEEHKKEMTPKIVYGKNKRKAPAPRSRKAATKGGRKPSNTAQRIKDSEGETATVIKVKRGRPGRARVSSNTDESVGEDVVKVLPHMKGAKPTEEDTIMETADEEDEIVLPPPRTQRGRKTVQSFPSTAATVETDAVATGRPTRGKGAASIRSAEKTVRGQEKGSSIEEVVSTKPLRDTRGKRRVEEEEEILDAPDTISDTASEELPEAPNPSKLVRKRRRPEDMHQDDDQNTQQLPRESSAESVIQVAKRVKTTPMEKTPVARRGKRKDATLSPLLGSERLLGDTQYTFHDTQSQAPELKAKAGAKKKRAPPSAKKPPAARRPKSNSQPQTQETYGVGSVEEVDASGSGAIATPATRTRSVYEGDSPKIVFSNSGLDGNKDIEKFLRANGGKKMQNVSAAGVNFLVVGPGELKRTPKLTVGVALGKFIVDDQWLIDSKELGCFLDPEPYIPRDPIHEEAWSFSLATAIERGRKGLNCVLKDYNVYITPSLVSQLKASKQEDSLVEMLKAAGARTIIKKSPKGKREDADGQTLILGTEKGDGDIVALGKAGWSVYGTGIIAISVLRGKLDLGGEFRIVSPSEVGTTPKAGRGRKGK